jgi:hypothetical protein
LEIKSFHFDQMKEGNHVDNRQAKFILSAYRPGGQDATDPRFSEALEQARRDPILQRWFEESVAFDAAMTEKLGAITTPSDLRENILAGAKISHAGRWTGRFLKWAAAAVLILSVSVGTLIWHSTRPAHLAGWQNQALDVISALVRGDTSFDAQSHSSAELVAWLHSNDAPAADKLPANLGGLESLGCKTFSWNGLPVSVICFMRPDGGGLIHLVTTNASPRSDDVRNGEPKFVQQGDWATATWREGGKLYMLALEGSRHQLRAYL